MSDGPEQEQTPLRSRLGPYNAGYWERPLDDAAPEVDLGEIDARQPSASESEWTENTAADTLESDTAPTGSRGAELERAIRQTAGRVDSWVSDQHQRLTAGLDLMLAQLEERRQEEVARLEAWKASERKRVERELAAEEERFHERLMSELAAFEEQLALRLGEQEERLARWLQEAQQTAEQRFAANRSAAQAAEGEEPPS